MLYKVDLMGGDQGETKAENVEKKRLREREVIDWGEKAGSRNGWRERERLDLYLSSVALNSEGLECWLDTWYDQKVSELRA